MVSPFHWPPSAREADTLGELRRPSIARAVGGTQRFARIQLEFAQSGGIAEVLCPESRAESDVRCPALTPHPE